MKSNANISEPSWLYAILVMVVELSLSHLLIAQVSQGGQPLTFSVSVADTILTHTTDFLDVAALLAEDELEAAQDSPVPPRFGYAFKVSLGMDSAGTWTNLPNGGRLWRLLATPAAGTSPGFIQSIKMVLLK